MDFIDALNLNPVLAERFESQLVIEIDKAKDEFFEEIQSQIENRFDNEQNSDDKGGWAETQKGSPIYVETGQLRGSLSVIRDGDSFHIFAEGVDPHEGSAFSTGVELAEYLDSMRTFLELPNDYIDTFYEKYHARYDNLVSKYIDRV
tara:strand:+ start:1373 stop:1813 length:441 start_codon:yes stop_codon:yes gene_type:complete